MVFLLWDTYGLKYYTETITVQDRSKWNFGLQRIDVQEKKKEKTKFIHADQPTAVVPFYIITVDHKKMTVSLSSRGVRKCLKN